MFYPIIGELDSKELEPKEKVLGFDHHFLLEEGSISRWIESVNRRSSGRDIMLGDYTIGLRCCHNLHKISQII